MKRRHWTPLVAMLAALALAACSDQGPTGVDGPSVAEAVDLTPVDEDDGLEVSEIAISGTNFVTAGVGTDSGDAETITVDVPSGATVEQVFLYWARRVDDPASAPESEILVDGSTVTGDVIGGPIETTGGGESPVTYRADITGEGVVAPGTSSFTVEDDTPDEGSLASRALGASVLVFYDEGGDASEMSVWDGVDFAWADDVVDWRQTAVPVTFTFASSDEERTAELVLFVGDVEDSSRPNELDVTIDGSTTTVDQPFAGADGAQWDNFVLEMDIPAGVDEVTVEPISPPEEENSSSLVWAMAGLSVEPVETDGGEGCTPGYWRQEHHFDSWEGHDPSDSFGDTFDLPGELERPEQNTDPADLTLLEGLTLRGGGVNALIRHAVAALLNASSGDVSYDLTESEIVELFDDALGDDDEIEAAKDELEAFNEQGCPLD